MLRKKNTVRRSRKTRDDLPLPNNKIIASSQKRPTLERIVPEHEKEREEDKPQVVGVAQPQGFWSRFVMGERQEYIMALMAAHQEGQEGRKGFWQSFIEAQRNIAGKLRDR